MTSEPQAPDIAAVVVNYNAGSVLAECVASLLGAGIENLVVVDNGSTDDSLGELAARLSHVRVVHTGRNLGYGGGVNRGAGEVGGQLILVCNPDLVVQPGAVTAMADRLQKDQSLGLVGPALIARDGTLHPSGRAFPSFGRSGLQAALGVLAPHNAYSRAYREANRARAA